jgi:uncharacterized protein (DUF983 family)
MKCPRCNDTGFEPGLKAIDACRICTKEAEIAYREALLVHDKQMLAREERV